MDACSQTKVGEEVGQEIWWENKEEQEEMNYDLNQPRVPAGKITGGQWTSDGSVAGAAAREAAGLSSRDAKLQEEAYATFYGSGGSSKELESYLKTDAGQKQLQAAREHAKSLSQDGKTVILYRGMNGTSNYKIREGKLVSWTFDGQTAYNFASGEFNEQHKNFGTIFTAKVPIDSVYFTWKSFAPIGDNSVTGGMQEIIVREGNFDVEVDDTWEED